MATVVVMRGVCNARFSFCRDEIDRWGRDIAHYWGVEEERVFISWN